MAPFISGLRWFSGKRSVTKIALSQRIFETTRDFKFFSTDNVQTVHMKSAILTNRPAKVAKSAIFWMKPNFFLKKLENDPNSSLIMSAGSGRCKKSWMGITCLFMKKNVPHIFFFKKQFKKIHIFSAVNPLEKNEKKKFFSILKFGNFFFQKIKLWVVFYLIRYFGPMKKY